MASPGRAPKPSGTALLHARARDYKAKAMVVLLGGADAFDLSPGLHAVHAAGGLVLMQDPAECAANVRAHRATLAHAIDAVLPAAAMPGALLAHADRADPPGDDFLSSVMAILQADAPQRLDIPRLGPLRRRVRLRLVRLGLDRPQYLARLLQDAEERARLTQDILVHLGAFFLDRATLAVLGRDHLPALLASHPAGAPLRVWVPGCGTGEDAWSLAMVVQEAIQASGRAIPLELLASDLHPEVLATARAALYPPGITRTVSAERLASFFDREAAGWRIRPELRACAVFTRHDALADPPFAGLDVIACTTLMRYLPEAARPPLRARLAAALGRNGLLLGLAGVEAPARPPPPPAREPPHGLELERRALYAELASRAAEQRTALDLARAAKADLSNLIAAAGVNVLFLDPWLQLRLYTPGAGEAFGLGPQDLGRPLDALRGLPPDPTLAADAARVMREGGSAEAEVEGQDGTLFLRRVLPYRAEGGTLDGTMLGFTDIHARAEARQALEEARAERAAAEAARARFLAMADQDVREGLRRLQSLHGLLGRTAHPAETERLLQRQGLALASLASLLNRLLKGAGEVATGIVPEREAVPLDALLRRIGARLEGAAAPSGAALRLVPSRQAIRTDPVLFEQLLSGLLALALGRAPPGARWLLGCRRRGTALRVELWGRPTATGSATEAEFRRGLAPLRALAGLLGHSLHVAAQDAAPPAAGQGRHGPVMALDAPLAARPMLAHASEAPPPRTGRVLVVEPDVPERAMLMQRLATDGHEVSGAADQADALARLTHAGAAPRGDAGAEGPGQGPPTNMATGADPVHAPDLVVVGPGGGEDGAVGLICALRSQFGAPPALLLLDAQEVTGERQGAHGRQEGPWQEAPVRLRHPAPPLAFSLLVRRLLAEAAPDVPPRSAPPPGTSPGGAPDAGSFVVHLLHADPLLRQELGRVLERDGHAVAEHASAEGFLAAYRPTPQACLVLDGSLPGMSGHDLVIALRALGDRLPVVMLTGVGDVPGALQALHAGASEYLEQPVRPSELLAVLAQLRARGLDRASEAEGRSRAAARIARLTPRQRDIMDRVLAGQPSKNIAADLGISRRTVETHRAAIMRQTGAKSLPELARLALAAAPGPLAPAR